MGNRAVEGERHLAFTGTRLGCEPEQYRTLHTVLQELFDSGFTVMRNGACYGADLQAADLARAIGYKLIAHPGHIKEWQADIKPDITHPSRFTLDRNRIMVDSSELLVACPRGRKPVKRGSGTWATMRYAQKSEHPLITVWEDGSLTREFGASAGELWK